MTRSLFSRRRFFFADMNLRWAQWFKRRRNETRLAAIFLVLILVPSGLLGYFSWRALENEKVLSHERLQSSYRQLAGLAGREIDKELEAVARRWSSVLRQMHKRNVRLPAAADLRQLEAEDPLIAACFLLTAPGTVAYPPGLEAGEQSSLSEEWEKESFVREHDTFNRLVANAEELEYRGYDLSGALTAYREILRQVSSPQLRGMAETYVGRVLQKQGEWAAALEVFKSVLAHYPEIRDLNKMYLRFLAQFQMAVCLENLQRDEEAAATLLRLNQDLLERSDAISAQQYSYFLEQIKILATRLLSSPRLPAAASYQAQFTALAEQNKKRIGQKYILQVLQAQLQKMVIERKHYRPRLRYISERSEGEPFLVACHFLPDANGVYIAGLLGLQIDLALLQQQLFPAILSNLKFSEEVTLALLNQRGEHVLGAAPRQQQPMAAQALAAPFDFWQVGVYLEETASPQPPREDFNTTLGLWLISLLLLSILWGGYLFLRRARREAHLSAMKSSFVSSVSHELRTPLTAIKMWAELMQRQLADPPENFKTKAEQYLRIIGHECDRLNRLLETVLDFSKIETGLKKYNFEYEDPAAVLHMAVESFRPQAEAQGCTLETDIDAFLPEVRMDADAIVQVVLNLLSNALKYSDDIKEIRVRAYRQAGDIVVEVADRGIGIPAAEIPKIFDDFYRVDQRLDAQKQGGLGLGLTLARHIIHAHHGALRASSELGKGSKFVFTLPIPAAAAGALAATPQAAAVNEPVSTI